MATKFWKKNHPNLLSNYSHVNLCKTLDMNILPMHNALKPLAWLEGIWHIENVGFGKFPTIMPFRYCEELIFASVGQPMFNYSAQSWHSEKLNPMHRESGFLRVIPDTNKVMLVLAHNFGLTTIEEGEMEHQAVKLVSTNISRPTTGTKPPAVLEVTLIININYFVQIISF